MFKRFLIFCFVLIVSYLKSQDTLYFKNSSKLAVLLLEVNPENVKYKRFDNQAGATYTILKKDLSYVLFKNGTKEIFEPIQPETKITANLADSSKPRPVNTDNDFFAGTIADTIFFRSGKRTEAKVLIINEKEVRYKLFSFQDGPTYQASKYELSQISYGNGKTETFNEEKPAVNNEVQQNTSVYSNTGSNQSMYQKGETDAKYYYQYRGGSSWIATTTSIFSPFIGILPTLVVVSCQPRQHNLGIPPTAYAKNREYVKGYTKQAHKIKKKKVWTSFGIGSLVWLAIILLLNI